MAEVSKFLSDQPLRLFSDGEWIQAVGGGTFETRDPGTNRLLAKVAAGERPRRVSPSA